MTAPLPNLTPLQQQISQWAQSVPGLLSQTAAQVAAAYVPVFTPVPYVTFQPAVMKLKACASVLVASQPANLANLPAAVQGSVLTAVLLFQHFASDTVDLSDPALQGDLQTLVTAGIVTQADANSILALGQTYPIPGVTAIQTSDVSAVQAAVSQFNAAQALAQAVVAGQGGALGPINAYQNGPANGTPPTDLQIVQAFAAAAFPGKSFTITGG